MHLKANIPCSLSPLRGRKSSNKKDKRRVLRSVSADRDRAYFNILGSDGLVGTGRVLQDIELARATTSITDLEVEDIVCRKQNTKLIFGALEHLFLGDEKGNHRPWSRIKFTDTIHVFAEHSEEQSSSRAVFQLIDYETKQQELWDLIGSQCNDLPLAFEVKVMIDEGTSIDAVLQLLRVLPNSSLEKVSFGGGLVGCKEADIPTKLASLFLKLKSLEDSEEESYCTLEMIMVHLFYLQPHHQGKSQLEVLPQCINKLTSLKTGVIPRRLGIQNTMATALQGKSSRDKHGFNEQAVATSESRVSGTARPVFPKQHDRKRRKDRIRKSNSKEDPLGGTSHHSKSKAPRRRRIKRQNSLPETDPDKAFARKNSTEINLDKWATQLEKKTRRNHCSSRGSQEKVLSLEEPALQEDPVPRHKSLEDCTSEQRAYKDQDDPLGSQTSHDCGSKRRPRRHAYLKRQNSLPETKPDVKLARQNTAELKLDQSGRIRSTVVGAAA